MKIAIPIYIKDINSEVSKSFGRAPIFAIYEKSTKLVSYIENTAAVAAGGAGIKAAQILVDNGVKIILAPRLGENAATVLNDAGIVSYEIIHATAQENIDAFENSELKNLAKVHKGFHGHSDGK